MTPETLEQKLRAAGYEAPSLPHLCRSCDSALLPGQPCGAWCQRCHEEATCLDRSAASVPAGLAVALVILMAAIGAALMWIGLATLVKTWWSQ